MYSKHERPNNAMVAIAAAGVSVGRTGVVAVNINGGTLSLMPLSYGPVLDNAMQTIISTFGVEVQDGDKPMFAINQWLNKNY